MADNVEDRLCTIITDHLNCANRFSWNADLRDDLGADSLDLIAMPVAIEDEFDIVITDDAADRWSKASDILETVKELV